MKKLALAVVAGVAFASLADTYYCTGSDSGSVWIESAIWSADGGKTKVSPSENNDYVIPGGKGCRVGASYLFPTGSKLIFGGAADTDSGSVSFKGSGVPPVLTADVEVRTGLAAFHCSGDVTGTLDGSIALSEGTGLELIVHDNLPRRNIQVDSDISGSGNIHVLGSSGSSAQFVKFGGSLVDFTGDIGVEPVGASSYLVGVYFLAPDSFPGDPDELSATGFTLGEGSAYGASVYFYASGAFGPNRGFVMGEMKSPSLYVADGETVVINGPLAGTVGFNKTGPGTLILSNATSSISGTVTVKEGLLQYIGFGLRSASVVESGGTAEDIEDLPAITATAVGYTKTAGEEKHVTVTVTDPAGGAGCTYQWSHDDIDYFETEPVLDEPGFYTVYCQISAEGYKTTTVLARVLVDVPEGDFAFVAPRGASNPESPYATPETAANSVADALVAGKSSIIVASGTYIQGATVTLGAASLFGPVDRSANFFGCGFTLNTAGSVLSGVTVRDVSNYAINGNQGGAVISNCCVIGGSDPVTLKGTLVDSVIDRAQGTCAVTMQNSDTQIIRSRITNCRVTGRVVSMSGGLMEDTVLDGNESSATDASAATLYGSGRLIRCRFLNNSARFAALRSTDWRTSPGLAKYFYATNCLFACNRNSRSLSDSLVSGCGEFTNCTLADNLSVGWLFDCWEGHISLLNVVSTNDNATIGVSEGCTMEVNYSVFAGAAEIAGGTGNLSAAPRFVGTGDDPYQLKPGSPGVDAGRNVYAARAVDLLGRRRTRGGRVDMGCYETLRQGLIFSIR